MPDERVLRTPARALTLIREYVRAHDLRGARDAGYAALEEFPFDVSVHDALAEVLVARDEPALARDVWDAARAIDPNHVGAAKGLAFLAFRRGDLETAERLLTEALQLAPNDAGLAAARRRVRAAGPEPRRSAAPTVNDAPPVPPPVTERAEAVRLADMTLPPRLPNGEPHLDALCCTSEGLVVAGDVNDGDEERRAAMACEMSALARSLEQAAMHLSLGAWTTCLVETASGATVMACVLPDGLTLTRAHGEGAAGRALARSAVDVFTARQRLGSAL